MAQSTQDIVQKLWNLCNVLRDDGITYHQYVTELTYLLFLKMAEETGTQDQIPEGYRWSDLQSKQGIDLLDFYRLLLIHLGSNDSERVKEKQALTTAAPPDPHGSERVKAIFANASTSMKVPRNLETLVKAIHSIDWFSAKTEGLGDLYEGLLEKNANEKKSGAGQYFTPRPLIESIVALVKPKAGERVQDPAAGTGGFLIEADKYIKAQTDELSTLPQQMFVFQREKAFYGVELVQDAHRLAMMNLMLHDIHGQIEMGDTLSSLGERLPKADVILTNPPFGTKKGGGMPTRGDFTFDTSNKQLAFLQHIYRGLKPNGRAAVVLPDNVLFEDHTGREIRADLMDKCDLHTILRLPTGIFYAQGVKTNVLFFTRGRTDKNQTQNVWVYDLRTNMPSFGKRTPFTREHLTPFEAAFGADPFGKSPRKDTGESGRFRCFTRKQIEERQDNLDISWLKDDSLDHADDLPEPDEIAAEILALLQTAQDEMEALTALLNNDEATP